jgi:predicted DNA-binding transcriptional regulator YafY
VSPGASRASADRLGRLLNLVPYLLARPGIELAEAATDLGVSERQLREDLELLWVCGLPGYGPGDLIDMAFDGDRVTITYDAGIDRPLRLTPDEALALVVALRMLAETPGTSSARRWRSGCPVTATGSRRCAARCNGGGRCASRTTPPPATRRPSARSTRSGC